MAAGSVYRCDVALLLACVVDVGVSGGVACGNAIKRLGWELVSPSSAMVYSLAFT
jgi:hypothetical protein